MGQRRPEDDSMRKSIITEGSQETQGEREGSVDVERVARVEITSENPEYPVESALIPSRGLAWQAERPGKQTIRLVFDHPLGLRRIFLQFDEKEHARTQEFVLRWLPQGENGFRDIVRQQYTFSPPGTTAEIEDYRVELNNAAALELTMIPDISGGDSHASVTKMCLYESDPSPSPHAQPKAR
jgi:hypothetical protein